MVADHIRKTLNQKSKKHQHDLQVLGKNVEDAPLSSKVVILEQTNQVVGLNSVLLDPETGREDFIFTFDRIATLLLDRATSNASFESKTVTTPINHTYTGLVSGSISAIIILRGGSILEPALRKVVPDCVTGRLLIQSNYRTGEPQLHYLMLPDNIATQSCVFVLDPQMSSGGAALMAVKVLVDHGVEEKNITFVTYFAGKNGLGRLTAVFPDINVVVCRIAEDLEERWMEQKYLGC